MTNRFQPFRGPGAALTLAFVSITTPAGAQAFDPLLSPAAQAPAVQDQGKVVLDQVITRYRELKNFSAVVQRGTRRQAVQFRTPAQLKVSQLEADGSLRSQTLVSDKELINLQKINDVYEYRVLPRTAGPNGEEGRSSLGNLGVTSPILTALLAGQNPFREGGRYPGQSYSVGEAIQYEGIPVLPLTVKVARRGGGEYSVALLVGQLDRLVYSIRTTFIPANGAKDETIETLTDIKVDEAIADAEFIFTPPAGATKVERFSPSRLRATVGQAPLPLQGKDLNGQDLNLEQYKGKVVLVDFWATWCGPCIAELPNVKAAYQKYNARGFDVLGISLDRSADPLKKYVSEKEIPWRQVFDGYWEGPLATAYNVRAIPATLLIGKDGKVAAIGVRGAALDGAIEAALAQ